MFMKKSKVPANLINNKPVNWIAGGASLITIYFNAKIQDPFNAPKAWILLITAAWLTGHLVVSYKTHVNKLPRSVFYILIFFVISNLISLIFSTNKKVAFLGENMRRDGFLTYLSFIIFLVAGSAFIRFATIKRFYVFGLITSLVLGIYGIMQWTGNDFVQWSDHGNNVISTLGNSNFAGSMMAIALILMFGGLFFNSYNNAYRSVFLISIILLGIAILPTNARQALVILALGIGLVLTVWVSNHKPLISKIMGGFGIAAGLFAILGMLQIGPLKDYLYKDSVTVRGFYWRAGIKMFQEHFLFGVGLDNYGSYFKEYRSVQYPLKYGFNLTSTNAHNVFIQQFATGGIFVGALYLAIVILIALRGFKALRMVSGEKRLILGTLISAWIAYQAQSIISIDNIGISIWGWVLGGAILGLSIEILQDGREIGSSVKPKNSTYDFRQQILSSIFVGIAAIFVVIFYRGESAIFQQRAAFNPSNSAQNQIFHQLAIKTINTPLIDDQYKVMTASYLGGMGFTTESLDLLNKLYTNDPRNLDTLTLLASFNQQLGKYQEAINYRKQIAKLDPWNAENYLVLGRYYKQLGDKTNMQITLDKILSFASNDPIAATAKSELTPQ
jgi:O-antigen ligase